MEPWAQLLLEGGVCLLIARLFALDQPLWRDREGLDSLEKALTQIGWKEVIADLQALRNLELSPLVEEEYSRLFLKGEAPPLEGSYQSPWGVDTNLLADISGFYRAFGFKIEGERPDHVGAEMEFLGLLCIKEAYALLSGEIEKAQVCAEARAKFLHQHLLPWLLTFKEKVSQSARHPLFPAIAELTAKVISLVKAPTL